MSDTRHEGSFDNLDKEFDKREEAETAHFKREEIAATYRDNQQKFEREYEDKFDNAKPETYLAQEERKEFYDAFLPEDHSAIRATAGFANQQKIEILLELISDAPKTNPTGILGFEDKSTYSPDTGITNKKNNKFPKGGIEAVLSAARGFRKAMLRECNNDDAYVTIWLDLFREAFNVEHLRKKIVRYNYPEIEKYDEIEFLKLYNECFQRYIQGIENKSEDKQLAVLAILINNGVAKWDNNTISGAYGLHLAKLIAGEEATPEELDDVFTKALNIKIDLTTNSHQELEDKLFAIANNEGPSHNSFEFELILDLQANPNCRDKDNNTPLMLLAENNHFLTMQVAINHNADPSLANDLGMTALMIAAKAGNVEAVSVLIQNGADVMQRDKKGLTAMHYAAQNGNKELIAALLQDMKGNPLSVEEKKAVIEAQDNTGLIVSFEHEQFGGKTPLMYAAINNNADFALELLDKKQTNDEPNYTSYSEEYTKLTAMHYAAINNNPRTIAAIFNKEKDQVDNDIHRTTLNFTDENGRTPLYLAVKEGAAEAVEQLLKLGANQTIADKFKVTPKGEPDDTKQVIESGVTPLMLASGLDNPRVLDALIRNAQEQGNLDKIINQKDVNGATAMHYAAKNGNVKAMMLLSLAGASRNAVDKDNNTPLVYALNSKDIASDRVANSAKFLLGQYDKNVVGEKVKDFERAREYLKAQAKSLFKGESQTKVSGIKSNEEREKRAKEIAKKYLFKHENIDSDASLVERINNNTKKRKEQYFQNKVGVGIKKKSFAVWNSKQHKAREGMLADFGSAEQAYFRDLLNSSAQPSAAEAAYFASESAAATIDNIDKNGVSPLIHAIRSGNLAAVKLLLETSKNDHNRLDRIDVNKADNDGLSPLMHACMLPAIKDSLQMAMLLIKYGAKTRLSKTSKALKTEDGYDLAKGTDPLIYVAMREGNAKENNELIKTLLTKEYAIKEVEPGVFKRGAFEEGNLVTHGSSSRAKAVKVKDKNGFTPLHHAALAGNYEIAVTFLERGINPREKTSKESGELTVFDCAALSGAVDIMQHLLNKAKLGKAETQALNSALIHAITSDAMNDTDKQKCVDWMTTTMAEKGIEVSVDAIAAAVYSSDEQILNTILDKIDPVKRQSDLDKALSESNKIGPMIALRMHNKQTVLHRAAKQGNIKQMITLLNANADVTADGSGATPFDYLIKNEYRYLSMAEIQGLKPLSDENHAKMSEFCFTNEDGTFLDYGLLYQSLAEDEPDIAALLKAKDNHAARNVNIKPKIGYDEAETSVEATALGPRKHDSQVEQLAKEAAPQYATAPKASATNLSPNTARKMGNAGRPLSSQKHAKGEIVGGAAYKHLLDTPTRSRPKRTGIRPPTSKRSSSDPTPASSPDSTPTRTNRTR